jgi:Na+/Pi-cotransporter
MDRLSDPHGRQVESARSRHGLAWLLVLAIGVVYALLPDAGSNSAGEAGPESAEDAGEERERLEILSVSPHDPYAGGTLAVTYSEVRGAAIADAAQAEPAIEVFAGKVQLAILAQQGERLFVALPKDLALGDAKIRVASARRDEAHLRSKPFHIRVRAPSYRKLFRSLVGGVALVVLGIFFLSRGVRAATSLHAAELLSGASKRRAVLLTFGTLLGGLAQTTTGAISLLSGLVSSRMMGVVPAAIACLTVPLGAALAPLLVTGLVEPREGLLIVAMGVVWLLLGRGRRLEALASLLLGTGLVAYGMQVFRPALEPFLADATVWSLVHDLRAESVREVALCAGLGALAVALMHGPGPLVVLLLSVAQATHHGDLRTLLALLSGTSAGAALAGLITAPASLGARRLAKLHLLVAVLASLLQALSIDVWVFVVEGLFGRLDATMHWTERAPVSELGLRLFVSFFLSQSACALALSFLVPRLSAFSQKTSEREAARQESSVRPLREVLDRVLRAHGDVLNKVYALAQSGERRRGQEAEQALREARHEMDLLLGGPLREAAGRAALGGVAFSVLQLQNALDHLLAKTERMIDAQVAGASGAEQTETETRTERQVLLDDLHRLLSEGLDAARVSLSEGKPLDLDAARGREIQMNRIEASARALLLAEDSRVDPGEGHLSLLQVVDAYEASGNQVYRLAEQLGDEHAFIRFGLAHS